MAQSGAPIPPRHEPSAAGDICYILYTSGTTGRPKGVAVQHQSICNFVRVAAASYGYRPSDRVYQGMTIAFDFSMEEIWVPFAAGSAIVPAPGQLALVGEELADFLRANRVTCMACSPTLLSSIESDVPRLRLLLVGGEACPQQLVVRWSKPGRQILNTYGPTEATVTATMGVLTPDRPVTIGKPLPTYSIAILDAERPALAAPGEPGEIGIAGIGLAAGYLNRPDLTEEKFIADFLGLPDNPSKRIYRTGDLGRIGADGEIEYHGRIDTQVKIRGYRIELGEIEAVLLDHPAIGQAAVTTWESEPGRVELVGYYALKTGAPPLTRAALTAELKRRLPDYMVPADLEELPVIPMTVSDKVDLRQLPKPARLCLAAGRRIVPPRNGTEQFLADALAQVLGSGNISVDDHFFDDLGANSLLMARLCARIRTRKPWAAASMRDIYLHPTVARLAKHLHVPQDETPPVHEPACVHRATNFAYWACGTAQMLFYGLYGYAGVWTLNLGLSWVYGAIGDPAQFFLRSLAFWAAMFFGMTGVRNRREVASRGPLETGEISHMGAELLSLLGREDADPDRACRDVPGRPALQRLPAAARGQDRGGRGHQMPLRAGVHRHDFHRRQYHHSQGIEAPQLPGAIGIYPCGAGDHRPRRLRRRGKRPRHRHQDRRRRPARPCLLAPDRTEHSRWRVLARIAGGPRHGGLL